MTLTQVWGAFLLFTLCPILGALPLTGWLTRWLSGIDLAQVGTKNVSVSAAFYHGGKLAGIASVLAEAAKGIVAVLLARHYFPQDPTWEVMGLIGVVMGRYWRGKGAGTTNVVWGFVIHDPITAGLTFLISFIGFTVVRQRQSGRLLVLGLLPVLTALRHGDGARIVAVAVLSGLIAWIYQKIPDDLELSPAESRVESRSMFRFFRGDRALLSLDQPLDPQKVGEKAATLAQLRQWGYPVPMGYVLPAGDDPMPLIDIARPSPDQPIVARSSAIGEDTPTASAAGQYVSRLDLTSRGDLENAIARCFAAYNSAGASRYRQDRNLPEAGMAVVLQQQVQGQISGVAFSRDPVGAADDGVVIEALPGGASQVVSGRLTPEQYRVTVSDGEVRYDDGSLRPWQLPEALTLPVETQGTGTSPARLIQQVAFLARHLEARYHGIPQDVEWTFDGEQLWLLQSRPITTLYPLWTRKIAAEVIPGAIRPLTWSINRPLTCGVWGDLFTVVLGDRAAGLDFEATATLHNSHAYFNASLLGDIFRRMGLPAESLEFLTRGAKFSKPPLLSTLGNVPGLLRLLQRELALEKDFAKALPEMQAPLQHPDPLHGPQTGDSSALMPPASALISEIQALLTALRTATYFNILGPLSLAIRQGLFKVSADSLDNSITPEVASLQQIRELSLAARPWFEGCNPRPQTQQDIFERLPQTALGRDILTQFDQFLDKYGYLSDVGTDIAVPTWREDPGPVRALFTQFLLNPPPATPGRTAAPAKKAVQQRLNLKGQITRVYGQLLARLRYCFIALGRQWVAAGHLATVNDIFFLRWDEVQGLAAGELPWDKVSALLDQRRQQYAVDQARDSVPLLVYGSIPAAAPSVASGRPGQWFQGIGASAGIVEGTVLVVKRLQSVDFGKCDRTILVVPYTDAGWAPLLAQAAGLIAEAGGRLSHGAIVAREYGIPAVMDVADATQTLQTGQRVRLDGSQGTVEILGL